MRYTYGSFSFVRPFNFAMKNLFLARAEMTFCLGFLGLVVAVSWTCSAGCGRFLDVAVWLWSCPVPPVAGAGKMSRLVKKLLFSVQRGLDNK
jgi:hypothetical protein